MMPSSADDESHGDTSSRSRQNPGQQPQKRAKRARYISIACNECKRRKIKCNGETPCRRCGHLDLECVYAPSASHNFKESQEYKQMTTQINTLQQAVQSLSANPSSSQTVRPQLASPSQTLLNPGVQTASPFNATANFIPQLVDLHTSKDPIWSISKEDTIRLVRVWENNIHIFLPIINMDRTLQHIDMLHSFLAGARKAGLMQHDKPGADAINDHDTLRLKLMLSTAVALEAPIGDKLSCRLFANVVTTAETLLYSPADLDSIEILMLSAICAFYKSDEKLAWRLIGVAVRMLFELGMNRHNGFNATITRPADRYRATVIMWSIYLLDRRWSVLEGLPPAIQVDHIDHYRPGHDCMFNAIELTEITDGLFMRFTPRHFRQILSNIDELRQMDCALVTWYNKLADNLKFCASDSAQAGDYTPDNSVRLLLALKTNQYRLVVGHPVFLFTVAFNANINVGSSVVDIARHTIRIICQFSTYPKFRSTFVLGNQFLLPCIALLSLAVMHASQQFHLECREDMHNALELLRHEEPKAFVGKKTLHVLKVLSQIDSSAKLTIESSPDSAAAQLHVLPPFDFSPDFTVPYALKSNADGVVEESDTIPDLIDRVKNMFDTQIPGRIYNLLGQDALTKILRDLF